MRLVPGKAIEGISCKEILMLTQWCDARKLADDMISFMERRYPDGLGLAAPQIGEYLKVVVLKERGEWVKAVNPIYSSADTSKPVCLVEACLSYTQQCYEVLRFQDIVVDYWDITGEPKRINRKVTCFPSIVWQHEIDHLNGITIHMKGMPRD